MARKWQLIKDQIDAGCVVCAGIDWAFGGKHYVVIWGYEECKDDSGMVVSQTVYVQDPYNDPSNPSYEKFVTNYRNKQGTCSELDTTQP